MGFIKKTSDKVKSWRPPQKEDSTPKDSDRKLVLLQAQCPHCGHWVSGTISKNILDRFASIPTLFPDEQKEKDNQERVKKYGKFLATIINSANDIYQETIEIPIDFMFGTANVVAGIIALEHCPNCGHEIILSVLDKEARERHRSEREKIINIIGEKPIPFDTLVNLSYFYDEKYEPGLTASFEDAYSAMINNFTQVPAHHRRFIYFVDKKIEHLSMDCITLPFNRIPDSIQFYKGLRVQKDTLYVLHPYKSDIYIPYDSLDVALFDEEMSEFLDIMSKLGAKSITFERYRDHVLSEKNTKSTKESVEVSELETAVGATIENHQKDEAFQKIVDTYKGVKEYDLSMDKPPYIPDNLVWLPHRDNWKREIQDRLDGRSRKIDLQVGFQQNELVTKTEKEKLDVFISDLETSAKYGSEREDKHVLREMRSLLWRVNIEFYPLSEYKKKTGIWPFSS